MHLVVALIALLCFGISESAMPRRKGLGVARKKTTNKYNLADARPVLLPRRPKSMDHEEGMPENRKRKASTQRSLSVDSDKVESSKEIIGYEGRRLAIGVYFLDRLDAPPQSDWDGVDGTVAIIHREFELSTPATIRKVLIDVALCQEHGLEYSGKRKETRGGHNKLIQLDSMEMQIAADAIEGNLGYTQATFQVNEYRTAVVVPAGTPPLIHVGRSAVVSAMRRLKPTITKILDSKQGSDDETQPWAKARLGFSAQLLIRCGKISEMKAWEWVERPTPEQLSKPELIPPYFQLPNIGGLIEPNQIAWWDECHKKPIIGGHGHDTAGCRTQTRFLRDAEGKLDPSGSLGDRLTQLKVKYAAEESRYSYGVAMIPTVGLDGVSVDVGTRLVEFDYSGKWVRLESAMDVLIDDEIARVKKLDGDGAPWVVGKRLKDGSLFLEDSVDHLPGTPNIFIF
jgi:hypothetical protein